MDFEDLIPIEILSIIIHYVPLVDTRRTARLVCRRWASAGLPIGFKDCLTCVHVVDTGWSGLQFTWLRMLGLPAPGDPVLAYYHDSCIYVGLYDERPYCAVELTRIEAHTGSGVRVHLALLDNTGVVDTLEHVSHMAWAVDLMDLTAIIERLHNIALGCTTSRLAWQTALQHFNGKRMSTVFAFPPFQAKLRELGLTLTPTAHGL